MCVGACVQTELVTSRRLDYLDIRTLLLYAAYLTLPYLRFVCWKNLGSPFLCLLSCVFHLLFVGAGR